MINDGLGLARGDVLCHSRTERFALPVDYKSYHVLTHPVSLGRALDGGVGAAFVYVLERVDGEGDEHWHITSEYMRATAGTCWRRWRAGAGLESIVPA